MSGHPRYANTYPEAWRLEAPEIYDKLIAAAEAHGAALAIEQVRRMAEEMAVRFDRQAEAAYADTPASIIPIGGMANQSASSGLRDLLRSLAFPQSCGERPRIVCLCGSTRFIEKMAIAAWEEEKAGRIALGCHLLPQWYAIPDSHGAEAEGVADSMDELHLRKIDLADEVLVINVGGYIGESTARELAHARATGKPVRFLEDHGQ